MCYFRPVRRIIELMMLLKALGAFFILIYIHIAFSQSPATCLDHVKNDWPRDGILRVEILRTPQQPSTESKEPPSHIQKAVIAATPYLQNLLKSKNLDGSIVATSTIDEENQEEVPKSEEILQTVHENENFNSDAIKSDTVINESQFSTEYIHSETDRSVFIESTEFSGIEHVTEVIVDEKLVYSNETILNDNQNNADILKSDLKSAVTEMEKLVNAVWPDEQYIVEYSLEYGFLRLSPAVRQKLDIPVHIVHLDPQNDQCFGDTFSRLILSEFLG